MILTGFVGDRNGTIKGSLRYNAKVALQLKRAQANVQRYAKSSDQMKRQVEKKREQATTRLKSRLIKRASKSGKSLARVGDASASATAVVLPVQENACASGTAEVSRLLGAPVHSQIGTPL